VIGHYKSRVIAHRMANNLHNLLTHLYTSVVMEVSALYEDANLDFKVKTEVKGGNTIEFYSDILDK
jgi:hypothetical protein